jgi:hypothetical protein
MNTLDVKSGYLPSHCLCDFLRKMFVRQDCHWRASRRRCSASSKAASISAG